MTHKEADRAMILHVPVIYRGIEYPWISGLVYRKDAKSGGMVARGELFSSCGNSVTIARLDWVDWLRPADRERPAAVCDREEQAATYQELQAKRAFWARNEIDHEGERWTVSALIVRKWMERPYWTFLELSRIPDRLVREVWSGSVAFTNPKRAGEGQEGHAKEAKERDRGQLSA